MQKNVIALGAILLNLFLFFIGSFFLHWGLWNYFYGSALPGVPFGIAMAVFGIFAIALGIFTLLKTYGLLTSKSAEPRGSSPSDKV